MTEIEKPAVVPEHVSIIMDGNGRWAKERGKERLYGHFEGVASVRAVTECCVDWGIRYLSLYAFSEENWQRPASEVDGLMKLMFEAMSGEVENFMQHGVRFRVLGNRARLSDFLNSQIDKVCKFTEGNSTLDLIIFLSYSGRWDIAQAAEKLGRAMAEDPSVTPDRFQDYLVTAGIPDPDLLIRTSGEKRLSNYLLWQCAYTEFVFTDTLWPNFRKEEFAAALKEFAARDRRYGKVK